MAKKDENGSRKHVLSWVAQDMFISEMKAILAANQSPVESIGAFMPNKSNPQEAELDKSFAKHLLPQECLDCGEKIRKWWLAKSTEKTQTPNWDIAAACEIKDRNEIKRGLILVEAKAHVSELNKKDKSGAAGENAKSIKEALQDASDDLNSRCKSKGFNLSADNHYQLSNRIAYVWKLAQMGIPTILAYLGFTGYDPHFGDDYLRDHKHWTDTLRNYMQEVVPLDLLGKTIHCEKSWFKMLIISKPIE